MNVTHGCDRVMLIISYMDMSHVQPKPNKLISSRQCLNREPKAQTTLLNKRLALVLVSQRQSLSNTRLLPGQRHSRLLLL